MKKFLLLLVLSVATCFPVPPSHADASRCRTDCRIDSGGNSHCKTVCR